MPKIFFILLNLIINFHTSNQIEECETPARYFFNINQVNLFRGFSSFKELTSCNKTLNIKAYFLEFIPNRQIIIDESFQLNKILSKNSIDKIDNLCMVYFKGIDIKAKSQNLYKSQLYLIFSKLELYSNDSLIDPTQCNQNTFNRKYSFFASFNSIFLLYVKYPEYLCPLIFSNSVINYINFDDISNSFLNKNRLRFTEINNHSGDVLIRSATLNIKYDSLTTKILNKYVFKYIYDLEINGYLNDIQTDLFSHFNIKIVDILIDNYRDFFSKGNKWMKYLNNKVRVNLSDANEVNEKINEQYSKIRLQYKKKYSIINEIYEYPDEDFCLFQHFPHDHLVFPMIIPGKKIKCSCTVLWLVQYYSYYININYSPEYQDNYQSIENVYFPYLNKTIIYCHDEYFNESIKKCNFTNRLLLCKAQSINKTNEKEDFYDNSVKFKLNNNLDLLFLIKWLQFVLNIICQPFLATLGIINNILTIATLVHKNNKKLFKDKMYTHILINSVFNILFCLICLFKLVNECLFYNSNIFCSGLYLTKSAQYFKIVIINYFGTIINFCKNLTFISFTLSRYILVLNKSNKFFTSFRNMNFKLYIIVILLIGFLLNLYKLFQYEVMDDLDPTNDFPREIYSDKKCHQFYSVYCSLFNSLKILNSFINDILFFVINFAIDLFFVNQYGKFMNKKAKILNASPDAKNENKKQKKRVTRMVVIVGLLFFVSHFPEFLSSLILLIYSENLTKIFDYHFSTSLINEEAQVFTLVSISCQFYVFLKFNNSFYAGFKYFLLKIKYIKN